MQIITMKIKPISDKLGYSLSRIDLLPVHFALVPISRTYSLLFLLDFVAHGYRIKSHLPVVALDMDRKPLTYI